jgi:RHS repeat-associated protein
VGNYFEWSGSNSTKIRYYYAEGQRVAMRYGTTVYFLLTDHLGSTAITATGAGALYSELRYKAWGGERYSSATETLTTFRFTGQRQQSQLGGADGLYYYGARWYDNYLAHFIQPDSIVPDPYNPQDWDRYSYGLNNPSRYVDPDGHWPCSFSSSGFSCSISTFGLSQTIDRASEKLFGVKNASDVLSNAMSTFSLGADVAAEALDIAASTIVATGTVIGATGGAAITLPGGGTAVVTGAAGASVGWAMAEIGVRPLIFAGNLLASASTISTVGSELISGDTGYEYTVDVGAEGAELYGRVAIGSGSQISTLATSAGWASPIAYPSLLIQTGAVLGDLGVISPPPIQQKFNLRWGYKEKR